MTKSIATPFFFLFLLFVSFNSTHQDDIPTDKNSWDYKLNEMNYLVLRASSINIIYGLNLTCQQAEELKTLANEIKSLELPIPDTKGNTYSGLADPRKTYIKLIEYLEENKSVPGSLKDQFAMDRMQEAEIIKRSLVGAQKNMRKKGNGCLRCHASPDHVPEGDVSKMETQKIAEKERREIDRAHIKAIFGEEGIKRLWKLRTRIDEILTRGQKYMLKDFRCTFIPPEELKDPTNIGQAFDKNKWMDYFREIRGLSDDTWKEYKQLYLIPVEDIIEAKLPGIKRKYKKQMLRDVEQIIEEARAMDEIDFELKKEMLCSKLQNALNIDFLIGANKRKENERQFIAAMFLLFPGSIEIYDKIIGRGHNQ
jgi:hypothetical protein